MSDLKWPPRRKKAIQPPLGASRKPTPAPNSIGSKSDNPSSPDGWLSKDEIGALLKAGASERREETRPLAEGLRRVLNIYLGVASRIETPTTHWQWLVPARMRTFAGAPLRHHAATRFFPMARRRPRRS